MAYPRQCVGCGARYRNFAEPGECAHMTIGAADGGTESPWARDKPGRLLSLGCMACGAIYEWDYFGHTAGESRLGARGRILRSPVAGWAPGSSFALAHVRRSPATIYSRAG